ncbi:MAG: hypothetical protein KGL53_05140, partial [Elusimicrobia bacterium]|nr:hypothetical protein [Elusimicrobiota bacterium]
AAELDALAGVEASILQRLRSGAVEPAMTPDQAAASQAAQASQGAASAKAGALSPMVEGLERDYGLDMSKASGELEAARREQSSAEGSLSAGDVQAAQGAEERALQHLSRGSQAAQQALSQAQAAEQASMRPFGSSRPVVRPFGGGRGRTGGDTGYVTLPGAREYEPPKAIRGEVEKSLQEKRPAAYGDAVDEYLKRLSQ